MHPFISRLLFLVFLLSPSLAFGTPAKYYVPPSQFSAAFQIMDRGLSNVLGLFQKATGSFAFDDSAKTIAHLKIAIDAESLTVANPGAARDLAELLKPDDFPEIVFMATAESAFKDNKSEIKGTLTLHGVSKPAAFNATLNQAASVAQQGGNLSRKEPGMGLSLKGSFKRADFNMGDEPEMPGRFGDTITLMLEMQALEP